MNFGFDESVCLLSGLAMISTLVIPGADVRQRMIGLVGGVGLVGYSFYVANQTSGVIVLPIPLLALGWALPGKAIYDHFKSRFRPGDTQMGGGLAPAKPLPNTRGHETPSDSTPAFYQFRGHMMIADPAGETVEGKGTLEFGAAGVQGTFRKQLVAVAWDQVAEIDFREDSDNAAELMIFLTYNVPEGRRAIAWSEATKSQLLAIDGAKRWLKPEKLLANGTPAEF